MMVLCVKERWKKFEVGPQPGTVEMKRNLGNRVQRDLPSGRLGESQQDGDIGDVQGIGNSLSAYSSGELGCVTLDVIII